MNRFFGPVGYGQQTQTAPGVYRDQIIERPYYGDVIRNSRNLQPSDTPNDNISVQNSISIVADAYARENFINIRYVKWQGVLWTVSNVTVQHPRLLLQLGEVYHGETP
jgi:hypothetical protein